MKKRICKRLFIVLLCLALVGGITVLGINGHVKKSTADQILSPEEAAQHQDAVNIRQRGSFFGRKDLVCCAFLHMAIDAQDGDAANQRKAEQAEYNSLPYSFFHVICLSCSVRSSF